MNIKEEKQQLANQRRSSVDSSGGGNGNGIKILNEERIASVPSASLPMMTTPIVTAVASPPSSKKQKQDHYMLTTVKGEVRDAAPNNDLISFVLTEDDDDVQVNEGVTRPTGEITEEFRFVDEKPAGEEGTDEKTEEIVEHVCGKCYKSFRRFSGLKKHLDFCRFDSGYHLRKAEMIKNLEKIEKDALNMEVKDICFCCGESYDTFHLGHINCPDCPKSFKSQTSYERHIFITHSESNDHPCSVCNAKLRSANLLNLHEEQHQNRGKPFACKECGKDFTRAYHLKRHQKYSSCSANIGDSMSCKVCNKAFFRLDNLRAHLKQHLGNHVTKKPEYMCPICKNCFYSLSTLNIHTRTHTGERPFDCDLCEKKFPSLVALKKHRRYHTGEKPYTCSVCNQSFAVKEVLNRHMKRHTGERPHVCNECGKSFIQGTQLRSHIKTHLRPYPCTVCPEKFKTQKQLERHSKVHAKGKRARYVQDHFCKICNAAFRKPEQLEKHMELGNHIPPVTTRKRKAKERTDCAICEKNFDTVNSLQFHILKVHEVDPEEFINSKVENDGLPLPKPKIFKIDQDTIEQIEFIDEQEPTINTEGSSGVVVQEFIVDENPMQTIILENDSYTVIPMEPQIASQTTPSKNDKEDTKIEETEPAVLKNGLRKSLAAGLAAALADEEESDKEEESQQQEELDADDLTLKENVAKLLDMLVDKGTLKKFGWPGNTEENVLCKVIENCGHDLTKDGENYKECEYATRMREYVKLLFTVVIHNDSIKELLNNYPIDEVIEYVLGNDDDDDDDDDEEDDDSDDDKSEDIKDEIVKTKQAENEKVCTAEKSVEKNQRRILQR